MSSKNHDIVIKLFETSFSARERKIVKSDLFGESYPQDDLAPETCLSIVAEIRPSVRRKLKPLQLIPHLSRHFSVSEQDQVDIVDTTLSESERASRLLDSINIKSSFPIAAFYIALIDSSNEKHGPPTHHQLACEMKRIVQEKVSEVIPALTDKSLSITSDFTLNVILDGFIRRLRGILITQDQSNELTKRLGIEMSDPLNFDLSEILTIWKEKKGMWVTLYDITENIVLTRGIGHYVKLLRTPPYPHLKNFLEGLNEKWTEIAVFIGFEESDIEYFVSSDTNSVSTQLDVFLNSWTLPDCGEKTGMILHKLRRSAMEFAKIKSTNNIPMIVATTSSTVEMPITVSASSYSMDIPIAISTYTGQTDTAMDEPLPIVTTMYSSSIMTTVHSSMVATTATDIVLTTVNRSLPLLTSGPIVSQSLTKTSRRHNIMKLKPDPTGGGQPVIFSDRSKNSDPTSLTDLSYELPSQDVMTVKSEGGEESQPSTTTVTTGDQPVWPSPIQQSHKSVTLPYTHTTSHVHFTAPVSTTNPTWSTSPHTSSSSSHMYVVTSRSSPEDSPAEDDEATKSLPPDLPHSKYDGGPSSTDYKDSPHSLVPVNINEASQVLPNEESEAEEEEEEIVKEKSQEEPIKEEEKIEQELEQEVEQEVRYSDQNTNNQEEIEGIKSKNKPLPEPLMYMPSMVTTHNTSTMADVVNLLVHNDDVNDLMTHCKKLDNSSDLINERLPMECSQNGNYLLHIAVRLSKRTHVIVLLDFKANVDQIDEENNGQSALHIASENGDKEMMEILLNRRATVDIRDGNGSTPLLLLLLANLDKFNCMQILLQYGAHVGAINNEGITPLVVAVVGESLHAVELLLERDTSLDVINYARKCKTPSGELNWITPLADAAARGNLNIVKLLIDKGANLNSTGKEGKPPYKGRAKEEANYISPLLLPCANNHVNVVQYITQHSRFVCQIQYIADPLTEALRNGHTECAQLIWERYEGGIGSLLGHCAEYPQLIELLGEHAVTLPTIPGINDNLSELAIVTSSVIADDGVINDLSALEDNDANPYSTNTLNDLSDIEDSGSMRAANNITMNNFDTVEETVSSTKQPQPTNLSSDTPRSTHQQLNTLSDIPRTLSPQLSDDPPPRSVPQLNTLSDPPRSLPTQRPAISLLPQTLSDPPTSLPLSDPPTSLPLSDPPRSLPPPQRLPGPPRASSPLQLNTLSEPPSLVPAPSPSFSASPPPRSLPSSMNLPRSSPTPPPQLNTLSLPPSLSTTANKLSDPPAVTPQQLNSLSLPPAASKLSDIYNTLQTSGATPITTGGARPDGGGVSYDTLGHDSATDTDNPFEPRQKTPPAPSSPLQYSADESMRQPMPTVEVGGNLRNFQTSAVEVLHDFAQYLIQACLVNNSPVAIIAKAEEIDETALVHFFTRYFYDSAGAARGGEFVAEFIKGFPSPLNFIISTRLCTKADFVNVLSEMGREDFTEQLMLALHQFQDSDNIPWSGSELLNALFYQHFSVGTPYPIAAMHDRMQQVKERTLQHQLTQDHSSSAAATATEQPFPGKGRKLGGSALDSANLGGRRGGEHTNHADPKKLDLNIHVSDKGQQPHDISADSDLDYKHKLGKPVKGSMGTTHGLEEEEEEEEEEEMAVDSGSSLMETNNLNDLTMTSPSRKYTEKRTVTDTSADEGDPNVLPLLPLHTATVPAHTTVDTKKHIEAKEKLLQLMRSSTDSEDEAPPMGGASIKVVPKSEPAPISQPEYTVKEKAVTLSKPLTTKLSTSKLLPQKIEKTSPKVAKKVPSRSTSSTSPKQPIREGKILSSSTTDSRRRLPTVQSTTSTESKSRSIGPSSTKHVVPSKVTPSSAAGRNIVEFSSSSRSKLPAVRGTKQSMEVHSPAVTKRTVSTAVVKKSEPSLPKTSSPKQKPAVQKTAKHVEHSRYDVVVPHTTVTISSVDVEKEKWLRQYPIPKLKENVPETKIEKPISLFEVLGKSLTNWKMLGRYLGLPDESLDTVSKLGSDSTDMAIQMLKLWLGQSSRTQPVTYRLLGEALMNCMKDELIVVLVSHSETLTATRSVTELSHSSRDDDSDMLLTVPISRVLSTIKPIIEDQEREGKVKVTVSLKFH